VQPAPLPAKPPAGKVETVSASAPQKFSNLPAEGLPQQLVILAVDMVNTPVMLQGWAKTQTIKYLSAHPAQQPLAVVAITADGLREVCSFTTDTARLIASINKLATHLTSQDSQEVLLSSMDPQGRIDTYTSLVNQLQERNAQQAAGSIDAGGATLRSFEQLAWAYSGVPGRKTVLWLTSGFPIVEEIADGPTMLGRFSAPNRVLPYSTGRRLNTELLPEFQRAFTALNKADVIVYPVDVKGLPTDDMWDASQPAGLFIHPAQSHLYPLLPNGAGSTEGMTELAHRTGGKTCTAGNNLQYCLDQALGESSDYYMLGFYVPEQDRKLGWHKLKVSVNVDHGEVRARSTYYLRPLGAPLKEEQDDDLRSAIHADMAYTGIIFNVEPGAKGTGPDAPIVFKITVPASSVQLLPGEEKLSFDVIAIPLSRTGTPLGTDARIVNLDIAPGLTQKALTKGWNLLDFVPRNTSAAAVKVIVRDNGTGRVGSVVFPLALEAKAAATAATLPSK